MTKPRKPVELLLELDFPDKHMAQAIFKALEVEIRSSSGRKADVDAGLKGRYITIRIASSTSTSMRAITNSYLRWIYSMSATLGELRRF